MSNTRSRTPKQPHQRPNPPGYYSAPLEDLHDGKLFRVRDDENLYGSGLPWDEAFKLKDKIAGRKISTTVMTEEMDDEDTPEWVLEIEAQLVGRALAEPEPEPDTSNLAELRASAKQAAANAAAAANARHASRPPAPKNDSRGARPSVTATAKLLATPGSVLERVARVEQAVRAPKPEPEPDDEDPGIDPHDALDGLGDIPDDESIAAELAAMTDGTTDA